MLFFLNKSYFTKFILPQFSEPGNVLILLSCSFLHAFFEQNLLAFQHSETKHQKYDHCSLFEYKENVHIGWLRLKAFSYVLTLVFFIHVCIR